MKLFKVLLLGIGLYILWITVQSVGIRTIGQILFDLRWQFLPVLAVYPFVFVLDTLGWAYAFPRGWPKAVPFLDFLRVRVIGETLNGVIPWAASLGGEPIKAELLKMRYGVSRADSYASILIIHTTLWISLNLFLAGGVAAAFETLPLTPVLRNSVLAFLVGLGVLALLLIIGLHWGIFKNVYSLGESLRWWGDQAAKKKTHYLELDDQIKRFYTSNPARFALSTAFCFLGWFAGVFETYFILNILDIPVNLAEAWLLEALIQVLRIVTFFIPSSIGAQEGGIVLIFLQFGFEQSTGLAFALLRRIREILWIGVGLALWSLAEDKPTMRPA